MGAASAHAYRNQLPLLGGELRERNRCKASENNCGTGNEGQHLILHHHAGHPICRISARKEATGAPANNAILTGFARFATRPDQEMFRFGAIGRPITPNCEPQSGER